MALAGEPSGNLAAHADRYGASFVQMDCETSTASRRRLMAPLKSDKCDERSFLTPIGSAKFMSDATGDTAVAARTCAAAESGSPAIREGSALPDGWVPATAVAANEDNILFRLGTNWGSNTGPTGQF